MPLSLSYVYNKNFNSHDRQTVQPHSYTSQCTKIFSDNTAMSREPNGYFQSSSSCHNYNMIRFSGTKRQYYNDIVFYLITYFFFRPIFPEITSSLHMIVIMRFPLSGYQHRRADNQKTCILNGERLSCPHATSSEMTLRHFNGAVFFFYTEIDNVSHFYIKNSLNRRF